MSKEKNQVPEPKLDLATALMQQQPPERERFPVDLGLELGDGLDKVELIMPSIAEKSDMDKLTVKHPDPDDAEGKIESASGYEYAVYNVIHWTVYPGTENKVFNMDQHFEWMLKLPNNTSWFFKLTNAVNEFILGRDVQKAKKK